MHDELRNHAEKEELDQANGEAEASPVMTVLHNLQAVTLEVNITIKVHFVEGFHGNLVRSTVLGAISLLLEVEVEFDGTAGKLSLLIAARTNRGNDEPPSGQKGNINNQGDEDKSLQTTTDFPFQVVGYSKKDGNENSIAERVGARAVGGKGGILDGRVLQARAS